MVSDSLREQISAPVYTTRTSNMKTLQQHTTCRQREAQPNFLLLTSQNQMKRILATNHLPGILK